MSLNYTIVIFLWVFEGTYKWQSAVCAPADLGLVHVDKDLGVSERSASTVARDDAVVGPANGLLVDQFDGSVWARLVFSSVDCPALLLHRFIPMALPKCRFRISHTSGIRCYRFHIPGPP